MDHIQRLCSAPSNKNLPGHQLKTTHACDKPICAACQYANSRRRPIRSCLPCNLRAPTTLKDLDDNTTPATKESVLLPGSVISCDQFHSTIRGRNKHTARCEPNNQKFVGGTILIASASRYIHAEPQQTLCTGDTICTKANFERYCNSVGVKVKSYRADNHPFALKEFRDSLQPGHGLSFSGVGAHHKNGSAKKAMACVTSWARTLWLHTALHWPDQIDLQLWPFALTHAVWLWNHMPRDGYLCLAPIEIFTGTNFPTDLTHLRCCHVWGWGCPTWVLDPKLQDGKKVPQWSKRARLGVNLGFSTEHSTTVSLILNPSPVVSHPNSVVSSMIGSLLLFPQLTTMWPLNSTQTH